MPEGISGSEGGEGEDFIPAPGVLCQAVPDETVDDVLTEERGEGADTVKITLFLTEIDQMPEGISGSERGEGHDLIPAVFGDGRAPFL